ncbi:MAG: hypothetical protein AB1421_02610 [Pseudomonadota bacterium]
MDRRAFLCGLSVVALMGCAGKGTSTGTVPAGPLFSEAERKRILDYYARERRGPGREQPAQRARIGDVLDSGQRPARLPDALDKSLPYLPDPHARLVLGADVILVNRQTHVISDVISQVAY